MREVVGGWTTIVAVARLVAAVAVAIVGSWSAPLAAGRGEPGPVRTVHVAIVGDDTALLRTLHDLDVDVDAVFHDHLRAYVIDEEIEKLLALGIDVRVVPEPPPGTLGEARAGIEAIPPAYHTYETLTADLQAIAADHPDVARLVSIGKSVQNRDLWMLKITRNPDVEEDEPEFLYVAAMHGDEVVGKEMAYHFADWLTDNDGVDPRASRLIDETEIWILPSMNPDGTALARRYNANFVDLNRDFPDQFTDPVNTPAGREAETAAIMNWAATRRIALSANFHGGALVANYPFDGNPSGSSVYSPTPEDDLFVSIARTYADANPAMFASNSHASFNHGVCNGADWYAISGGIQDWSWVWRGDADLTLEISSIKWPAASTLPGYWDDNFESMLAYLERVHDGARGTVLDAVTLAPLAAEIRVAGSAFPTRTDPDVGDWHRVMQPGLYDLEISAPGHVTRLVPGVSVPATGTARVDVRLQPLATDLQAVAGCVDLGGACDPWLPAGAVSDVRVTLRNTGSAASSISGTLESIGRYANVTRAQAGYPDLASGATGDSAAPGHGVEIDPAVPPGHKVGFVVRWQAAEGEGVSEPMFLAVGAETCVTLPAGDVPRPVADRATADSAIDVVDDLEIATVRVAVDVRHTYRADLRIDLVSPAGTAVTLHDRSGGSADDVVGTYGIDLVPFESFDRLRGEASAGAWHLRVGDEVPANVGSLAAWSVTLCGRPFEAATPEMTLREVARDGAGTSVTWWPYPGLTDYRVYRSTDPSQPGAFVDVTGDDPDPTDTRFFDASSDPMLYWLVTGVGPAGEGPKGHFGE